MESDKSLIKELEKDLKKDKILKFMQLYAKHIIVIVLIIIIAVGSYFGYLAYVKHKADKNSVIFSEVKDAMSSGDTPKALILLDKLIKEGTNGYVFVSYLEKVNILMAQGKTKEALDVLKESSTKISLPSYYKDMLKSLELMNRMNNNQGEDLSKLALDMKANLREKDPFYFHNLEMYAATLFMLKKYDESLKSYLSIIDNEKAPNDVKDRAKRAKAVLISLK